MVNVKENYKLIQLPVGNKIETVRVNTSEAWNVMVFECNDKKVEVNEGDEVEFVVDSGEIKQGTVLKLSGKGAKTKIKIAPNGLNCEEIWSVVSIKDGSFKVVGSQEMAEDDDSEDDDEE